MSKKTHRFLMPRMSKNVKNKCNGIIPFSLTEGTVKSTCCTSKRNNDILSLNSCSNCVDETIFDKQYKNLILCGMADVCDCNDWFAISLRSFNESIDKTKHRRNATERSF